MNGAPSPETNMKLFCLKRALLSAITAGILILAPYAAQADGGQVSPRAGMVTLP